MIDCCPDRSTDPRPIGTRACCAAAYYSGRVHSSGTNVKSFFVRRVPSPTRTSSPRCCCCCYCYCCRACLVCFMNQSIHTAPGNSRIPTTVFSSLRQLPGLGYCGVNRLAEKADVDSVPAFVTTGGGRVDEQIWRRRWGVRFGGHDEHQRVAVARGWSGCQGGRQCKCCCRCCFCCCCCCCW